MKRLTMLGISAFLCASVFAQGKIVVANDEWTLSDTGYANAPDADRFARNVANWFTGGSSGNFLVYSNNFGLTGTQLANTMTNAGHSWTVSTAGTLDLSLMSGYDAIFLGGYYTNIVVSDLITYVQNGGNVYLCAGTGIGGAVYEAGFWNPFLNAFGLDYEPRYNGVGGNISISNPHPIFAGVSQLYQANGNSVIDLQPSNPNNEVLVSLGSDGLYAVYVPEPASMLALSAGLAGLLGWRRRK